MTNALDPVELSRALIRCPSVTPADAGALGVLEKTLSGLGFDCHRLKFTAENTPDIDNLYARFGTGSPNFCFAGHTDVVPVGDEGGWAVPPFEARIENGKLYGRGASDMKTAIASFAVAAQRFLAEHGDTFKGSISFLITGDEEGPAINGTKRVLEWLAARGETLDACIVGEPTNPENLGDMIKIGRRGSLNVKLAVRGVQGHSAYPHLADNPVPKVLKMLSALNDTPLDDGNDHFQPSTLAITTIDVGNPATNVTPAQVHAAFNVRFNDEHTSESIIAWVKKTCDAVTPDYDMDVHVTGESFLTPPGPLSDILSRAVEKSTGRTPELSTTGGTSDARFIKNYCPVAEFGMSGQTMHKTDEHVSIADIKALADIYQTVLEDYFRNG
ncbi:MAG: succinyl-diaminopimelate desuccinylase [Rhodospirillales bacterium]